MNDSKNKGHQVVRSAEKKTKQDKGIEEDRGATSQRMVQKDFIGTDI